MNAGVDIYFYSGNTETIYEVGGTYMLPNSDLAINLGYRGFDGVSIIDAGVSWSFGPNQDMRLFQNRGFSFLFGT